MRVLSGLLFFPRGGSAHVARALATEFEASGHDAVLLAGSRREGATGDARRFFAGLDLEVVDFDRGDAPMHPSYEDRAGAADVCFGRVDDLAYARHVEAWSVAMARADARSADVLHLHHLTPLHAAAAQVAPGVPVVTHLHGTELLFLEAVERDPVRWPHGPAWCRRMRRWASTSAALLVHTERDRERAAALLDVSPERFDVVPNGVDLSIFTPEPIDREAVWRRLLVDEPCGWAPGQAPGSVRYTPEDIAHFADEPIVVTASRFTAVKRLPLLIRAFGRSQRRVSCRPSLVIVGGHPGEWEDAHPLDAARDASVQDVFLTGWRGHDELADCFRAADLTALASVREQFGLVLVEAMACGIPVVAVDRLGPAEIIDDGETGWLVPPDDEDALATALTEALTDDAERARRGAAAVAAAARYDWPEIAARVIDVLTTAADPAAAV